MTMGYKSSGQRKAARERYTITYTPAEKAPPAAPTPPENPFDAAYAGRPITPEFAHWDDRGYMRWNGPTHIHTYSPRRAYTPRVDPN